ncbi:39S ribosomal protein L18, mitochondrial-like [Penaeus chinensis]|uniref:39S ribosomal protein L18, mitochondrial-like n=1 Tax=Penaeus chinensis TaxID=139456 RepID=UPI001FB7AECE|nr:39S ribosomal protein L18, mitochondrial-like [Penaeus chinensis]
MQTSTPILRAFSGLRLGFFRPRYAHSDALSENDLVNPQCVNRNPRNMEMLRLARKPQGWGLDIPSCNYWYKLFLDCTQRHVTARVEHFTGETVVSASTKEWAIKQHLFSTTDINAVRNIGRIIAQRCLQSGISELHTELQKHVDTSEKIKSFMVALEEGGLITREPTTINERSVHPLLAKRRETLPWTVLEEEVLKEEEKKKKKE